MPNLNQLSDEALVLLLKQEDVDAFEELYNRYWDKLYAAAYKRVRSKETSEELVQDFFTSLWLNRNTVQIHSSFEGYLFTSIRYLVLNHLQKELVRSTYKEAIKTDKVDNSTEETVMLNDLVLNLNKEVEQLPIKCKSVFELSRREYKTNKEIALELGISEKTVENQLTKALRRIRIGLNGLMLSLILLLTI
ncbi:RNA polymerase sigma factor [compost metagenome]|uniref:RNA polymerase sigma-70 factor n=1 Tax=Pedobacter sp. ok626 TaxID=1761882 RepID=UPI000880EDFE|nr:RNA polymerase sigma-70 factor [Pedobacter sp. ok626]SDL05018.1 RNA polymerase sigma-70 factor, ECF subfamily [Pedobacter sp. ok626]